ncbi:hypothetical protein OTU49_016961 [Cherax quadricarinatus]
MVSLKLILELQPKVIYPGHGPMIDDPVVKIQHYIAHRIQRENQILKVLNDSLVKYMLPMEIVKLIYKDTPEHLHLAAENNVNHHLQKLFKDGVIYNQGNKWCLTSRRNHL